VVLFDDGPLHCSIHEGDLCDDFTFSRSNVCDRAVWVRGREHFGIEGQTNPRHSFPDFVLEAKVVLFSSFEPSFLDIGSIFVSFLQFLQN